MINIMDGVLTGHSYIILRYHHESQVPLSVSISHWHLLALVLLLVLATDKSEVNIKTQKDDGLLKGNAERQAVNLEQDVCKLKL